MAIRNTGNKIYSNLQLVNSITGEILDQKLNQPSDQDYIGPTQSDDCSITPIDQHDFSLISVAFRNQSKQIIKAMFSISFEGGSSIQIPIQMSQNQQIVSQSVNQIGKFCNITLTQGESSINNQSSRLYFLYNRDNNGEMFIDSSQNINLNYNDYEKRNLPIDCNLIDENNQLVIIIR